nr:hypothetical protein BaRGS_001547 [Batillaria attramentaria]
MHARGLKLGIYEDFGSKTCAGYPGSEFHMQLDAQTFADWGVDMVKFDGCNSDPEDMDWVDNEKNVSDRWDSLNEIISFWGDNQGDFIEHVGPGSFSDPDMIIVGDFGLSYDQQRVQMGMWAMLAAPLLMSNDLRKIDNRSKALLQNRRVIALNQDPLGVAASRLWGNDSLWGNFSFWVKPLASPNGSFAIAVFNSDWHGMPLQTTFTFSELGLESAGAYNVTEVFDGAAVGVFPASKQIELYVNPPGIVLWIAEPVSGMTVNRGDASVVVIG